MVAPMAERPSDLLPCPWCGEPLDSVSVSEGSTFRWRKVDGCCADGPEVRHDTVTRDRAAAEADSKRRAIEAWNTRARTIDAAPSEPSAEHWRRAVQAWLGRLIPDNEWDAIEWTAGDFAVDKHRARELVKEGK